MQHHPSCRENDKALVVLCGQCGKIEDASAVEEVVQAARACRAASYEFIGEARDRLELALAALERANLVPVR
jgi:hypothetical protein